MLYVEKLWKDSEVPNRKSSFERYYKKYQNKIREEGVPDDPDGSLYEKTYALYYRVMGFDPILGKPELDGFWKDNLETVGLMTLIFSSVIFFVLCSSLNIDDDLPLLLLMFIGIFILSYNIISFFVYKHYERIAAQCKVVLDILDSRKQTYTPT